MTRSGITAISISGLHSFTTHQTTHSIFQCTLVHLIDLKDNDILQSRITEENSITFHSTSPSFEQQSIQHSFPIGTANQTSNNKAKTLKTSTVTPQPQKTNSYIMIQRINQINSSQKSENLTRSPVDAGMQEPHHSHAKNSSDQVNQKLSCDLNLLNRYASNLFTPANDDIQLDSKLIYISGHSILDESRQFYYRHSTPRCTFATDKYGKITHTAQAEVVN